MAFGAEGSPPFIVALRHWRGVRGYSLGRLAALIGCHPMQLQEIESGRVKPSASIALRADEVLRADGAVIASLTTGQDADVQGTSDSIALSADRINPEPDHLVVKRDETSLDFDGETYVVRHLRAIKTGIRPLSDFTVTVSIDRYPGNARRSQAHHQQFPLGVGVLKFAATCGNRPLRWEVLHDADAYKEIRLILTDAAGEPMVPAGDEAVLEFGYQVDARLWGKWLQRVVRFPTLSMKVTMGFPVAWHVTAWGHQLVSTAAALPMADLEHTCRDGMDRYTWFTVRPEIDSVFRFEWGSHARPDSDDEYAAPVTARQTMQAAGIVQSEDPMLHQHCSPFDLPSEADYCRDVLGLTSSALDRMTCVHRFGKGQGIAAVQIGIPRAAATIRLADGQDIHLINPRIVHASPESDVQFEGCLSFFDVRGKVARPRTVEVEYQDLTGGHHVQVFRDGAARMVCHEVDHINGLLYTDRMIADEPLVPLSHYAGIGRRWTYSGLSEG